MGITVREVWELKEFQAFQLVAGEEGLDNRVERIGILDYEFAMQNDREPRRWTFRKYDFVISSLLFAKDHPELLLPAIKELKKDEVSALAVKNVCYLNLPEDVLEYADRHQLPIFMFGRDDAYFEDIVMSLKNKIQERSNLEWLEHKIALFLNEELDLKGQRELIRKILVNGTQSYRLAYCFIREQEGKIRDYHSYYCLKEDSKEGQNIFYYKGGCFVVMYGQDAGEGEKGFLRWKEYLQPMLRMPVEDYWIGFGEPHEDPEQLLLAMKESLAAQQYSCLFDRQRTYYYNMGIYKVLLPCYHNEWMQKYSADIVHKILRFDREYDGDLYKTVKQYVKSYGNIVEVAEEMHLHRNTVRYRINKIRELLDMEEDGSFDLQISVAIFIDELNQWFD